jgi:hypothetical protein
MARASAAAPLRRRPLRIVTAVLTRDGYEGSSLEMRSNAPLATLDKLDDLDDVPAVRLAVAGLIVRHNLVDDKGVQLELDGTVSQLTNEELWMIIGSYFKAMKERTALPKADDAT